MPSNRPGDEEQQTKQPEITVRISCADPDVIIAELADHPEVTDFEVTNRNETAEAFNEVST